MKTILNKIEKEFDSVRTKYEKQLRPIIEKEAIATHRNLSSTQWGVTLYNENRKENARFEKFANFIHTLSDDYNICFYFEVTDGKFNWLS